MIVASIYVLPFKSLIRLTIARPFMANVVRKIYKPLKSGIELMAGVPSIVYGYFGLVPTGADPPAVRRNRKRMLAA